MNPATLAYFVAVALGFAGAVLNDAPAFIGGVFAASLTWHAILAVLGGSLYGRLGPNARTVLTVAANGVVIALGLRILAQLVAGYESASSAGGSAPRLTAIVRLVTTPYMRRHIRPQARRLTATA